MALHLCLSRGIRISLKDIVLELGSSSVVELSRLPGMEQHDLGLWLFHVTLPERLGGESGLTAGSESWEEPAPAPRGRMACATPWAEAQYSLLGTSVGPNNLEVTLLMGFCPPNLQWM